MEKEKYKNQEVESRDRFGKLAKESKKESWTEHLRKARDLIRKKKSGEKVESKNYLLAEHMPVYGRNKKEQQFWKGVYKGWDECGVELPREIGEMVEQYVSSPDYVFGVHRSYAVDGGNYEKDKTLESIMKTGLLNLGDASSGAFRKDPPVSKTVAICPDMLHAVIQMKGSYKGSTGAILVAMPSEFVDDVGEVKSGMMDKVYDHNEAGYSILKPEFILGFAQNMGRGSTIKFVSRDELLAGYGDSDRTDETKKSPAGD